MTAPVEPADTKASASPAFCILSPTLMEEPGRRRADVGVSEAMMRSGAWTTVIRS